jgi:putative tryptophan/tyrosine transport system substrate-binding protein
MKPIPIALSVILALLAAPFASEAQQPTKVYRIGVLGNTLDGYETDSHNCPIKGNYIWQATVEGLRERGYNPGQNLVIECRWREGQDAKAQALAAELVSLKPDLILANNTVNVNAAKQATSTIPIVMAGVIDPVRRGLVASLAHPGGNVTGVTDAPIEMEGKRLQLLKEADPKVSRVAVLSLSTGSPRFMVVLAEAARTLGVTLHDYQVAGPEELASAFAAMTKAGEEAFFLVSSGTWEMPDNLKRIVEFAAQNRLLAIYPARVFADAGGLMAYDVDVTAVRRRIGFYVDKILKGTNPGDLPVEQRTKFVLTINLKTATALGLTIPPSLVILADEVIK